MVGVAALLAEARDAGLDVLVDSDRLVVRGPRSGEAQAKALLGRKAEVVAHLSGATNYAHVHHLVTTPLAEWTDQEWIDHFQERAAIIQYDGELPRPVAERQALADTINHWLVMHPPPATDDNDGCVHCRQPLGPDGVPVLAGTAHTWLHSACHHPWFAERGRHATEALRAMGIEAAEVLE